MHTTHARSKGSMGQKSVGRAVTDQNDVSSYYFVPTVYLTFQDQFINHVIFCLIVLLAGKGCLI